MNIHLEVYNFFKKHACSTDPIGFIKQAVINKQRIIELMEQRANLLVENGRLNNELGNRK